MTEHDRTLETARTGAHYAAAEAGPLADLGRYSSPHPLRPQGVEGKVFLKEALGLTGMEVSLNKLPARAFVPWYHKHRLNEELYVFIKGRGEFAVDDEIIPVMEGTVIRVAPEAKRAWRNDSDEDLYYLVIQARAGTMDAGAISDGEFVEGRVRWRKRAGAGSPGGLSGPDAGPRQD
jgi:mannose-6-phosphate isomerase-like protein (cupin superfamily)